MTHEEVRKYREIVNDASASPRLSAWEKQFVANVSSKLEQYGIFIDLSEKQVEVLERIEQKIYATG